MLVTPRTQLGLGGDSRLWMFRGASRDSLNKGISEETELIFAIRLSDFRPNTPSTSNALYAQARVRRTRNGRGWGLQQPLRSGGQLCLGETQNATLQGRDGTRQVSHG